MRSKTATSSRARTHSPPSLLLSTCFTHCGLVQTPDPSSQGTDVPMPIERASSGLGADEEAFVEAEVLETSVGYSGFFRLDVHRLRHRHFDGRMSEVVTREVLERGNAVAVVPYDPRRDEVLLIRQFLPGAYFGHPPRPLQIIAGMVGAGESEEDVARREAVEEAGCRIGRLERAHAFLPTPGGRSERVVGFCAEADLSSAGGVAGVGGGDEGIPGGGLP